MKNNITREISYKIAEKLVNDCMDWGLEVYTIQGAMLDNYLIDNSDKTAKFGRILRKYVIITEKYVNEWTSSLQVTFTDDEKLRDEFLESMDEEESA